MVKTDEQLITGLPLTAEARESMLERLFRDDIPHTGELFIPGHQFYIQGTPQIQARHILKTLCHWLGIKPGYIGLQFETQPDNEAPGHRHTIFLERYVMHDELLLGATIAHALTRYLLEQRKHIYLHDSGEQQSLIATGTIVFGLGLIVINGLDSNTKQAQKNRHELLGALPQREYAAMLLCFLHQRSIATRSYQNHLAPSAAVLLGAPKPKKPIPIMHERYHLRQQKRFEKIGIAWLLLLSIGLGVFIVLQGADAHDDDRRKLETEVTTLKKQKKECDRSVAYSKQYTDTSDLQTVRNNNAAALRCESLGNQLRSAETELTKLQ